MTPGTLAFVVAIFGLAGSAAVQAQQPPALTLACQGTVSSEAQEKPDPISMGIIVNFNSRTVQGFSAAGSYPVTIDGENAVTISFHGGEEKGDVVDSVTGTIDRVTGDAWAEKRIFNVKGSGGITVTYMLKCKPGQRKF
jgi:hypothetical protein